MGLLVSAPYSHWSNLTAAPRRLHEELRGRVLERLGVPDAGTHPFVLGRGGGSGVPRREVKLLGISN